MVKRLRVGALVIVAGVVWPHVAAAEMTEREMRQTVRAADYWLSVDFPLSAAIECDAQRGASGTWEADSTCNVQVERIAALVTLMTDGTFLPADAVTAWCTAAEIVRLAKEALAGFRRGPDMSDEARNKRAWESMWGYQQEAFLALNTTIATFMPIINQDEWWP